MVVKRLMSSTVLRSIADLVDAGVIEDFAVVATPTDPAFGKFMDFGQPPHNPDRMIEMLNEMVHWVGNKEKHAELAAALAGGSDA